MARVEYLTEESCRKAERRARGEKKVRVDVKK